MILIKTLKTSHIELNMYFVIVCVDEIVFELKKLLPVQSLAFLETCEPIFQKKIILK